MTLNYKYQYWSLKKVHWLISVRIITSLEMMRMVIPRWNFLKILFSFKKLKSLISIYNCQLSMAIFRGSHGKTVNVWEDLGGVHIFESFFFITLFMCEDKPGSDGVLILVRFYICMFSTATTFFDKKTRNPKSLINLLKKIFCAISEFKWCHDNIF